MRILDNHEVRDMTEAEIEALYGVERVSSHIGQDVQGLDDETACEAPEQCAAG